ncbi:MAG: hypothetical protein ACLUVV_00610 [Christensenellales bacterium]
MLRSIGSAQNSVMEKSIGAQRLAISSMEKASTLYPICRFVPQ